MSSRVTRSRSRNPVKQSVTAAPIAQLSYPLRLRQVSKPHIEQLPNALGTSITRPSAKNHRLLLLKQIKLGEPNAQIQHLLRDGLKQPLDNESACLTQAAASTLVFAQKAAGTAVCVSPLDLLLTCSHCVAEDAADLDLGKDHWLLFANGRAVKARCVAWDGRRDLALLQVIAAQSSPPGEVTAANVAGTTDIFPSTALSDASPKRNTALLCIGHPGSEGLEVDRPGVATGYDVLHISEGRYRELASGKDVHDNSETGALKHDCWIYWGHSEAPLVDASGALAGLHSSWDDEIGVRRGVTWEAMKAFLEERTVMVV